MPHSVPVILVVAAFITTVIPKIPVIVPLVLLEVAAFIAFYGR